MFKHSRKKSGHSYGRVESKEAAVRESIAQRFSLKHNVQPSQVMHKFLLPAHKENNINIGPQNRVRHVIAGFVHKFHLAFLSLQPFFSFEVSPSSDVENVTARRIASRQRGVHLMKEW
jgi:hypothetical protein